MSVLSTQPVVLSPGPEPSVPADSSSPRASIIDLLKRLTWLKAPWRTAKWFAAWSFSTWNLMRAGDITRVQMGCGKDIRPGWWNIDFVHFPGIDEIRDATLPWRHRNLQYVFAEHFIEHLSLHQGIEFLSHAGNALKPGGVIRISTPNLSNVVQKCYQLHGAEHEQRLDQTVGMNCCFHGYGHQFLYSAEFMKFLLEELGFENVRPFAFGESDDPNLRGLERHGPYREHEGIPNIITFEGTRGERKIGVTRKLAQWLDQYFDGDVYR
jgi:predicted SAM-dependent methyltransferase